jgi:hypothetical protein
MSGLDLWIFSGSLTLQSYLISMPFSAVQYVLRELLAWVKKLNDKLSEQQGFSEQETDMEVAMAMIYLDWSQKVSPFC